MVLENLLHGVRPVPSDGYPRSAAEVQCLRCLLHGYPHLGLQRTCYWESQEKYKVKYIKARIAEVTSDGEQALKGEDTLVKRPITIPLDLVVHAIGMDPNVDNMTLSAVFNVKLGEVRPHPEGVDLFQYVGDHAARCLCRRRRDRTPRPSTTPSRKDNRRRWRR